jgi:hypothetical protein
MTRVAVFLIILSFLSSMWPNGSGDGKQGRWNIRTS